MSKAYFTRVSYGTRNTESLKAFSDCCCCVCSVPTALLDRDSRAYDVCPAGILEADRLKDVYKRQPSPRPVRNNAATRDSLIPMHIEMPLDAFKFKNRWIRYRFARLTVIATMMAIYAFWLTDAFPSRYRYPSARCV